MVGSLVISGLALLCVVARATSAWAGPVTVAPTPGEGSPCVLWRGTVGTQPVAVRLEREGANGDAWVGEYGVPHAGSITPLSARREGETWLVEEGGRVAPRPPGRSSARTVPGKTSPSVPTWLLEARGADRVGMWRAADGRRTAPVLLSCLLRENDKAVDASVALLLGAGPPSRQLARLLRRGLTVDTEVGVGSARYRNAVDVILGRTYLQLTALDPQRPPRAPLLRELNERIRQHVAKLVLEQRGDREQFPDCDVESTVEIKYASPRFLTLSTFDERSCGSAHPEQNTTLETFDVSGERAVEVALAETYRIGRDARTRRAFWRAVMAARGAAPAEPRCGEDEGMGAHYELGVVQGGVLVDVDFGSYASGSCDFSVVVPDQVFQRFKVPTTVRASWRRSGRRSSTVAERPDEARPRAW